MYNFDVHHACQSQLHPWKILLPRLWQKRIHFPIISHGKEVRLPLSTGKFCKGLWRARLNDIRGCTITGWTRHKIPSQLENYGIHGNTSERENYDQNPEEGVIWELHKKWYQEMFRTYCPRRKWS